MSEILYATATSGGTIKDDVAPVVQRGVSWATDPMPTIENSMTVNGFGSGDTTVVARNEIYKKDGFSIRCVKD